MRVMSTIACGRRLALPIGRTMPDVFPCDPVHDRCSFWYACAAQYARRLRSRSGKMGETRGDEGLVERNGKIEGQEEGKEGRGMEGQIREG